MPFTRFKSEMISKYDCLFVKTSNEGLQPNIGILLVESYDSNLEQMINDINTQFSPMAPRNTSHVEPYNLQLKLMMN